VLPNCPDHAILEVAQTLIIALVVLAVAVTALVVAVFALFTRVAQVEKRGADVEARAQRHSDLLHKDIVPRLHDLEPVRLRALKQPGSARIH
jgi:hypothetical protein